MADDINLVYSYTIVLASKEVMNGCLAAIHFKKRKTACRFFVHIPLPLV